MGTVTAHDNLDRSGGENLTDGVDDRGFGPQSMELARLLICLPAADDLATGGRGESALQGSFGNATFLVSQLGQWLLTGRGCDTQLTTLDCVAQPLPHLHTHRRIPQSHGQAEAGKPRLRLTPRFPGLPRPAPQHPVSRGLECCCTAFHCA